ATRAPRAPHHDLPWPAAEGAVDHRANTSAVVLWKMRTARRGRDKSGPKRGGAADRARPVGCRADGGPRPPGGRGGAQGGRVSGPDGCRVSYLTVRDPRAGPTILLIHGSGVSAGYWVNQLRGLGRALRVVAIDLPGHGASDPIEGASVEAYAETTAHFLELL